MIYDYAILGAGVAGISLLKNTKDYLQKTHKRVLIIDTNLSNKKTHFFSFASKDLDPKASLPISKSWEKMCIIDRQGVKKNHSIAPYRYFTLSNQSFFNTEYKNLCNLPFINCVQDCILSVKKNGTIITKNNTYQAKIIFNSILDKSYLEKVVKKQNAPFLFQHFGGWVIESTENIFDDKVFTLMDLSVAQGDDTRFVYLLPFSKKRILIEYTCFGKKPQSNQWYNHKLQAYIKKLMGDQLYKVLQKEYGVIPMTSYNFKPLVNGKIIHIGARGGMLKASTGYSFERNLKRSKRIAWLIEKKRLHLLSKPFSKKKYRLFDAILLSVISLNNKSGAKVFEYLFATDSRHLILKFLNEETNFWQELRILYACPYKMSFIKYFFYHLLRGKY